MPLKVSLVKRLISVRLLKKSYVLGNHPWGETPKVHLSLLRQHQNMKGNDSTVQGKTKQHTKNIMQPKKHEKKLKTQLGCMNCFC